MNIRSIEDETPRLRTAHYAIQSLDWSATQAGAPQRWPAEWRAALAFCLHTRIPVWLALGSELELVYNDAFAALCGYRVEDALPMPIRLAWQEVWDERLEALVARVLLSERAASCPLRIAGAAPLHISLSALHDDLGRPIGVFGSASEAQFADDESVLLHELLRQGIRIRRLDEAVMACSSALSGVATGEGVVGLYLLDGDLRMAVRCGQAGMISTERPALPRHLEVPSELMARDILERAIAQSVAAQAEIEPATLSCCLIEERGEVRGFLLSSTHSRDAVGARRELLSAVAEHAGELMAYVHDRNADTQAGGDAERPALSGADFAMNLSRELQVPLNLLLKEIEELLRTGKVSPDAHAQLRVARRRARRLARLVGMLRELFSFDEEQGRPHLEPTHISSATRRLCEIFRPAFEQAKLDFVVECQALPHPAWVDRELWEKILCNLLANALKFTLKGEVRVYLRGTATELLLTVTDTGCGIDEADIPLVFDRFFAARPRGARSDEGAGVGLSWVRELVRLHGGTIRVASTLGRGSSFTVRIPYRRHEADAATALDEPAELVGSYEAPDTLEAMNEWSMAQSADDAQQVARILIVERDVQAQTYLRALLGARWRVDVVGDAEAAIEAAIERKPVLVLADTETSGVDGVVLARRLHADPRTAEIAVILVCGRKDEQQSIAGLGAGALDYVVKPLSSRELIGRVEARLNQARAQRDERAAREAAERESSMKDQVMALVAHELRTPLSAILGWLQVLRDDSSLAPNRRAKALEVIERNANAQARLLRDLFDVSRMVAGKFELELETVHSLHTVVESAVDALIHAAQKSQVSLETALEPGVGPLLIDTQRLQQVIWNLVTNALKFTPAGGCVRIVCAWQGSQAMLQVIDTGKGISREFLPHVFERFSQETPERSGRGLGIGLAISRCIVELHGGTISVHSEGDHRGTTFTVLLPCVTPEREV